MLVFHSLTIYFQDVLQFFLLNKLVKKTAQHNNNNIIFNIYHNTLKRSPLSPLHFPPPPLNKDDIHIFFLHLKKKRKRARKTSNPVLFFDNTLIYFLFPFLLSIHSLTHSLTHSSILGKIAYIKIHLGFTHTLTKDREAIQQKYKSES